jgi:Holliday junction DNA helicase RuvB
VSAKEQIIQEDPSFELTLRPPNLGDFVGQSRIKERLEVLIQAARQRQDPLEHLLFSGPPGLGKTTLANIIAREMGANLKTTSGPVIEKAGDLAGLLTTLEKGDVLFIDEIHRLNKTIEEYLYPAMEDYRLDIIIDSGPSARSVRLNLPKFTLIGATTRAGMISSPLRSRFGMLNRLDYYTAEELQKVVVRSARLLDIDMTAEGALEVARRSRGTPRISNNLLRWVRDFASVRTTGAVTRESADAALRMLEIDQDGLDEMDTRILEALIQKFGGGPVGLSSLAVAVGEEAGTLEEVHEPYLIMEGFVKRTAQGRVASKRAYDKLGLMPNRKQQELF